MALPSQTFPTIAQLISYINTFIVPNGLDLITGDEANSVLNALSNFIIDYTMNGRLCGISSSTGVVPLSKPVTIFTVAPTSINWADDVQFEYYIVNATGVNIPLTAGFSYIDQYGNAQTLVPFRSALHIAKAPNGSWFQINNLGGNTSGNLPPSPGHQGQFLETNGNSSFWSDPVLEISSADFANATDYVNPNLINNRFAIMWDDLPSRIYTNLSTPTWPASTWKYLAGGGFSMLSPGFDATANMYHFTLWLKGITS